MKSIAGLALSLGLTAACGAQSLGSIADVTIVDRDSGATLAPYYHNGEYWVAGRPGARYAIEIRNRLGGRLLAVTSVDGVNVLSGATAAWNQEGYVFAPGEDYQITGWRKSDAEVAAFTFTDSPNSYAERTGRPANVGVIGVALYRERAPATTTYAPPATVRPQVLEQLAPTPAPSRMAPSAGSSAIAGAAPFTSLAGKAATSTNRAADSSPAAKLGTGHGEREYSYVNHTDFARMQPRPNEIINIRYDSLDNLFAMGIVKRPRPAPPGANPFPASPDRSYVPDPPG